MTSSISCRFDGPGLDTSLSLPTGHRVQGWFAEVYAEPRLGRPTRGFAIGTLREPEDIAFVLRGTDMREHVLLFCLLGLVLTATIILATAPGAVTWALSLIE